MSPPGPVVEGTTVNLVCEATAGDLPISYTWTDPNGRDVSSGNTDGTISITVSSLDYGIYSCGAANDLGADIALVEVIRAGDYQISSST